VLTPDPTVPKPQPEPDTYDYQGTIEQLEAAGFVLRAMVIKGKNEGYSIRHPSRANGLWSCGNGIQRGSDAYTLGLVLARQGKFA
jgi:hypothetical protein